MGWPPCKCLHRSRKPTMNVDHFLNGNQAAFPHLCKRLPQASCLGQYVYSRRVSNWFIPWLRLNMWFKTNHRLTRLWPYCMVLEPTSYVQSVVCMDNNHIQLQYQFTSEKSPDLLKIPAVLCWLVVSNMALIFHFINGMSSFPLTFIFFSEG